MDSITDIRIIKTRRALSRAMHGLLEEKSFDKITVTEICQKAEVRKATFYRHFIDKMDLLEYMICELNIASTIQRDNEFAPWHIQEYCVSILQKLLEYLEKNDVFIHNILDSSASLKMQSIMTDLIKNDINIQLGNYEIDDGKCCKDMIASILSGAIINCGKWWITVDNRPDVNTVISNISFFVEMIS